MNQFLFVLLLTAAFLILFGHLIMSVVDRMYVYPKRLAKVQKSDPNYPPVNKIPAHLPPAVVSQLVFFGGQNKTEGKSYTRFTVTLLDLVHRQKVFVTKREDELYFSPLGDESDLLPYELTLKRFLERAAGERVYISLSELLIYIEAHPKESAEMRSRFLREVSEDFISRGYSSEVSYEKNIHPLVHIGEVAVSVVLGAVLGWLAGNIPLGLISVGLGAISVSLCQQVFRYKIQYLTERGVEMRARWNSYGRYLSSLNVSACNEIEDSVLCHFAVYAVALETEKTFTDLASLWESIAEEHPECILYDNRFFKKLTQIDNSILISNVRSENQSQLENVIQKGHG